MNQGVFASHEPLIGFVERTVTYRTPGTYRFATPPGVKEVRAIVVGAGGGASSSGDTAYGGGGGSAQALCRNVGSSIIVTVGAGGAGNIGGSGGPGGVGGASSFGDWLTGSGGNGAANVASPGTGGAAAAGPLTYDRELTTGVTGGGIGVGVTGGAGYVSVSWKELVR